MAHRPSSIDWSRVGTLMTLTIVGAWLPFAMTDPAIGWLIPIALGGGVLIAAGLFATRTRSRDAIPSVDRFADRSTDIINIATVRVAGLGGLGLVIVAGAVALQFPLIGAALVAAAAGGAAGGLLLILYRRRHESPTHVGVTL